MPIRLDEKDLDADWLKDKSKRRKRMAKKINNPDYRYWVVSDGKIRSGWEYEEDAEDYREDMRDVLLGRVVIVGRRGLENRGLDPDNNDHWGQG